MKYIDLHVHSTASDGFYSPKELLKMALDIKLEAMALTDHDAIAGIRELKKEKSSHCDCSELGEVSNIT